VRYLPLLSILLWPQAGFTQPAELPAYAYDQVAEISMATTAAGSCDGARLNDRKLQKAMVDLMAQLAADGLDPVASVQQFETAKSQEQIQQREAALRQRHGVAAQGEQALCDAIRAEVKTNKSLAKILKLR